MPVSILVPISLAWVYLAMRRGIVEVDQLRFTLWCLATGGTALMVAPQQFFVANPVISYTSWALIAVTWLPAVFRLVDRAPGQYERLLDGIVKISTWFSLFSVFFIVSQLLGLAYKDWFSLVVPDFLQLKGFIISYPMSFGSTVYKSNAWICLEPSFVSLQLGFAMVAGLIRGTSVWRMLILMLGMISAISGSGFAVLGVGVLAILFTRRRRNLLPYAVPVLALVAGAAATPFGQNIFGRLTEFNNAQSSTSARGLTPYTILLPDWAADPAAVLWGIGAGSSQRAVDSVGIEGLLVPTGVKIVYDYGFIGALFLCTFLFVCYLRSPSRVIMISLVFSMWTIQPGLVAPPFVLIVLLSGTWWSPQRLGGGGDQDLRETRTRSLTASGSSPLRSRAGLVRGRAIPRH